MTPVRIGLAGYGRGGRYFHAPLIGRAPECTLAGVLTRSPQRRAELAADFPGVPAFGRLGQVTGFESRMEQYPPPGGFSATGGGVLRDFGSHVADQALQLLGPAEAVYAEVHLRPEDGFDDRFFLAVGHAGGVTSHLRGDWTLHGAPGPRFRVTGSTGTFTVESGDGQSERLLGGERAEDGPFGTVPEARWGRIYRGDGVPPQPVPAEPGRWSSFYSALAGAVRGTGPLPVDPRDAVAALEVLDAARLSAARGDVVRLSRGR